MVTRHNSPEAYAKLRMLLVAQWLVVVIGSIIYIHNERDSVAHSAFTSEVARFVAHTDEQILHVTATVNAVEALYDASKAIEKSELARYIATLGTMASHELGSPNSIQKWAWIPARDNKAEPRFSIPDDNALGLKKDPDALISTIEGLTRDAPRRTAIVEAKTLGMELPVNSGTSLILLRRISQKDDAANENASPARGYIITLLNRKLILPTNGIGKTNIALDRAEITLADGTVINMLDKPQTSKTAQKADPHFAITSTSNTFFDAGIEATWHAKLDRLPYQLTPLRFLGFVLLSLVTLFAYQATIRQEQLYHSLEIERDNSEAAATAKSAFLANMSHEIRTPINAIIGMADLIQKGNLDARQKRYFEELNWSAAGLTKLIDDILDLTSLESNKISLNEEATNLASFVRHITINTEARLLDSPVKFESHLANDLPNAVLIDSLRLRQVLQNLLNNAVKFTQRGSIVLDVRRADIRSDPGEVWVDFVVKDTGLGIPRDKIAHVFGRFTQADATTKRKFGGTGLGLSIARELVELMQGGISVSSTPNQGTEFTVTVPLTVSDEIADEPMPTALHLGSEAENVITSKRLLIVDDDRVNRFYFGDLLTDLGHDCSFASDGNEAVSEIEKNVFDLVFMDCQMPICDGYTATMIIRSKENATSSSRLPIVALTAHAGNEEKNRCLAAGMDSMITKPAREKDLTQAIARWALSNSHGDMPKANASAPTLQTEACEQNAEAPTATPSESHCPPTHTDAELDLATMNKLRANMNESFEEMILCFIEDLNDYEMRIEDAKTSGNFTDAARIAHSLKSTSLIVGAQHLHDHAKQIEALLKTNDGAPNDADIDGQLVAFQKSLSRVADALKENVSEAA